MSILLIQHLCVFLCESHSCVRLYKSSSFWSHSAVIIVLPLLWKSLSSSFPPTHLSSVSIPHFLMPTGSRKQRQVFLMSPYAHLNYNANSPQQQFCITTKNGGHVPKLFILYISLKLYQRKKMTSLNVTKTPLAQDCTLSTKSTASKSKLATKLQNLI